jgi:hypothetical protein
MKGENKLTRNFIIGTFVLLYVMVSVISTIHVIDFFKLSNPDWLAITLAIAFEVGAAASLASIIALQKMNKGIVWALFFVLTAMQAMGNTYFAYVHLENYQSWIELFGLVEEEPIFQKRILSIVSGAILPLVALGFIKSLVDYIKPNEEQVTEPTQVDEKLVESNKVKVNQKVWDIAEKIRKDNVEKYGEENYNDSDEPTALANSQYREELINEIEPQSEVIEPEILNDQETIQDVIQTTEDDEKKN